MDSGGFGEVHVVSGSVSVLFTTLTEPKHLLVLLVTSSVMLLESSSTSYALLQALSAALVILRMAALFLTLDRDRSCSPPSWLAAADQSPVLGRLPPKVIFQGNKTVWWTLTGEPVVPCGGQDACRCSLVSRSDEGDGSLGGKNNLKLSVGLGQ